jgi:hypothetical protein
MPNQHKTSPVSFRPPEADRAWLYAHAEATGTSVGAILAEALARLRAEREPTAAAGRTGRPSPRA